VEAPAVVEQLPVTDLLSMAGCCRKQEYSRAQNKGWEPSAMQAEAFESISLHFTISGGPLEWWESCGRPRVWAKITPDSIVNRLAPVFPAIVRPSDKGA